MAIVAYTVTLVGGHVAYVAAWASMANGDSGGPLEFTSYADRSFQVTGTFGSGGTVRLEGSNDGTNWAVLHDPPDDITSGLGRVVVSNHLCTLV